MGMKKVLIIDDDAFMLTYIGGVLRKRDYIVLATARGSQGIELAEAEQPALIILDLKMPEMDGFAVLKALKGNDVAKDIPVLLLSGEASLEDVSECRALGASNYVMKPINPAHLMDQVKEMIGTA